MGLLWAWLSYGRWCWQWVCWQLDSSLWRHWHSQVISKKKRILRPLDPVVLSVVRSFKGKQRKNIRSLTSFSRIHYGRCKQFGQSTKSAQKYQIPKSQAMSKLFGRFESQELYPTHLLSNGNVVRKRPAPPRLQYRCKILMQNQTVCPYNNWMALTKKFSHSWKGNYM